MYEKIKKWYAQGLWSAQTVRSAQEKGVLTARQTSEILGE